MNADLEKNTQQIEKVTQQKEKVTEILKFLKCRIYSNFNVLISEHLSIKTCSYYIETELGFRF